MIKLVSLLGLSALTSAQVFSGQGKVVPAAWTSSGTIGEAVGCLTDAGLWTTDSANCGTFTGVATTESGTVVSTILSTSAGYCNIIFGGDIHDHLSYAWGNPDANTATATEVRYQDLPSRFRIVNICTGSLLCFRAFPRIRRILGLGSDRRLSPYRR